MRCLFLLSAALLISFPALSQELQIKALCSSLPGYDAGAEADYKPGVDVDGNPVAPADLNPGLKSVVYPIEIPVEIDFLKLINVSVQNEVNLEGNIAYLKVYEDGKIEYNDQDISDRAEYLCVDEFEDQVEVIEADEDEEGSTLKTDDNSALSPAPVASEGGNKIEGQSE